MKSKNYINKEEEIKEDKTQKEKEENNKKLEPEDNIVENNQESSLPILISEEKIENKLNENIPYNEEIKEEKNNENNEKRKSI